MYANAVLDDQEIQEGLNNINSQFGDFCTRVAGEAWGLPLIDQKTKALITIAVDVANQTQTGAGGGYTIIAWTVLLGGTAGPPLARQIFTGGNLNERHPFPHESHH